MQPDGGPCLAGSGLYGITNLVYQPTAVTAQQLTRGGQVPGERIGDPRRRQPGAHGPAGDRTAHQAQVVTVAQRPGVPGRAGQGLVTARRKAWWHQVSGAGRLLPVLDNGRMRSVTSRTPPMQLPEWSGGIGCPVSPRGQDCDGGDGHGAEEHGGADSGCCRERAPGECAYCFCATEYRSVANFSVHRTSFPRYYVRCTLKGRIGGDDTDWPPRPRQR